jgi:hypothetical protein
MSMDRDQLESVLKNCLAEIAATRLDEAERLKLEAVRWRQEWQSIVDCLQHERQARMAADQVTIKLRTEKAGLESQIRDLGTENEKLRELANVDAVQIALFERQVHRLEQDLKVLHTALLEQGWKGEGHD